MKEFIGVSIFGKKRVNHKAVSLIPIATKLKLFVNLYIRTSTAQTCFRSRTMAKEENDKRKKAVFYAHDSFLFSLSRPCGRVTTLLPKPK